MSIAGVVHWGADSLLSLVHLGQNRQVGWSCIDRKTGKWTREQQPLTKKLKLLLLFNPLVEWVDATQLLRLWTQDSTIQAGKEKGKVTSARQIQSFVDFYRINMNDFDPSDISAYPTFEDFFTRKHTATSRPIFQQDDPNAAVVVADSRVVAYESVPEAKKLWIKGKEFTMTKLVMDTQLGAKFAGGPVASFRLSPLDCHRFYSPVSGVINQFRSMPGEYYGVDPIVLSSDVDVLVRNARDYIVIDTEQFGTVLFVAIGAVDVGKVRFHVKYQHMGARIQKGDELGYFHFGGSSIMVAFEPGRIQFDDDLLQYSRKKVQVAVQLGMSLGLAKSAPVLQDDKLMKNVQPGWMDTGGKSSGEGGLWRSLEQIKTGSITEGGDFISKEKEGKPEDSTQMKRTQPEGVLYSDDGNQNDENARDGQPNVFHVTDNGDNSVHVRPGMHLNPEAKSFHGSLNKQYGLDDSSSSNEEISTSGLIVPDSGERRTDLAGEGVGVEERVTVSDPFVVTSREEQDRL